MDVKGSIAAFRTAVRRSAAERSSTEVIAGAWAVIHFISGFVLAGARLLGAAGPFGIAAVAASGAGLNGVCCLAGAALGYIVSGGLSWGIRYLASVVLVYTIEFAFQDSKAFQNRLFAPLTAGVVTLITGVLSTFMSVLSQVPAAAVIFLETAFAFGGCWFFREALSEQENTTEAEEIRHASSVLITVAAFLMALSGLKIFDAISVGRLLSLLMVMTCSLRCGMLTGCTVGTSFGFAMDMVQGGIPFYTMAYAFAGLLSGMFNRHGRLVFLLAFILANASAVACT